MSGRCPLCGGGALTRLGSVPFLLDNLRENVIVTCATCGHVMVDPTTVTTDLLSALYAAPEPEQVWSRDGALPYEEMVAFAGPALAAALARPEARVADFGYGHGHVLRALRDRFQVRAERLTGYDFQPLPLDGIATRRLDLTTIDESVGGQGAETFDLGFCSHVLEHIPDPRRLLRALRALARPGAHLYLETPDHGLLNDAILTDSNQICAQHLHYFTGDRLAALAASCGWTVVRQDVSQFGFVPRARLLLARDGLTDAAGPTRRFLDHGTALRDALAACLLEASAEGPVAAWGVGTDFLLAASGAPEIADRLAARAIVLYDRARAGASAFGATIRPAAALADFTGTIILTPRPAISRRGMRAAADRMGLAGRLVDPYDNADNRDLQRGCHHDRGA